MQRLDPALATLPPLARDTAQALQVLRTAGEQVSTMAQQIGETANRLNAPNGAMDQATQSAVNLARATDRLNTSTLPRLERASDATARARRERLCGTDGSNPLNQAMKKSFLIANSARPLGITATFCLIFLAGCSSLPSPPARAVQYDFGPGALVAPPSEARTLLAPLALADIEAAGRADTSIAVLYRLAYTDARQLRPYQTARWSQPPTQLVQQALRTRLGQRRAVLRADDALGAARTGSINGSLPDILRVDLEEFSHVFSRASGARACAMAGAAGPLTAEKRPIAVVLQAGRPALTHAARLRLRRARRPRLKVLPSHQAVVPHTTGGWQGESFGG